MTTEERLDLINDRLARLEEGQKEIKQSIDTHIARHFAMALSVFGSLCAAVVSVAFSLLRK